MENKTINKQIKSYIDQWNWTEETDKNPHIYGHLIFYKESGISHWEKKKTVSLTNGWLNLIATYRRMQRDPYVPPYTKLLMVKRPQYKTIYTEYVRIECGK